MFGEEEFKQALQAYERETRVRGNDDFTALRRAGKFFSDIKSGENVEQQMRLFINIISNTNRDEYSHRYVVQTFLLDFCKYLDKDFLFGITEGKTFFHMKEKLREFTGSIYENHKKFTQNVALNSMEHLLEDYGTLLKFIGEIEKKEESIAGFWSSEGKLW